MRVSEAKKRILDFTSKYKRSGGVLFAILDEEERTDYVLTKSYNFFRKFLSAEDAVKRAVKNSEAHKANGFAAFLECENEHMIIAK